MLTYAKIMSNGSLKNIPIPSKTSYIKSFISKYDAFVQRMRWKAFFFDRRDSNENGRKISF